MTLRITASCAGPPCGTSSKPAVAVRHAAHVAKVTGELEEIASRTKPPLLRAGLVCARPMLGDDDPAEAR